MTTVTTDQWSQLLHKAFRERGFRDELLASPKPTASSMGIELDDADVAKLQEILVDMREVDKQSPLNPSDLVKLKELIGHVAHVTHHAAVGEPALSNK